MTHIAEISKRPIQSESMFISDREDIPEPIHKKTLKTLYITSPKKCYLHFFRKHSFEIPCFNVAYSYKIELKSNRDCKLISYTYTSQDLMHKACDVENKLISLSLEKGHSKSIVVNFKRLCIATNTKCKILMSISPVRYIDCYSNLKYMLESSGDGHLRMILPMLEATSSESIRRSKPLFSTLPEEQSVTNIHYYINMSSAITATSLVNQTLRYLPYSVKLVQLSGLRCTLTYKILIKASQEEKAVVNVSCIESLSANRYSILRNEDKKELINIHKGQLLEGKFTLHPLPTDVGLHISTPYGFCGDLNCDMKDDLVKVIDFIISYSPVDSLY